MRGSDYAVPSTPSSALGTLYRILGTFYAPRQLLTLNTSPRRTGQPGPTLSRTDYLRDLPGKGTIVTAKPPISRVA